MVQGLLLKRLFIVKRINFDFACYPNTPPELRPQIRGKHEQLIYNQALAKVVVNDYEIPTYYQKPALVDEAALMEWGGTFFILGGDAEFLLVRYVTSMDKNPGESIPVSDSIPCDIYYSDLTGNWDADDDGVWGELTQDQADRFPEVFVGRIPAHCTNEVTNWVNKALNYEISPGFQPDSLITALWLYNGIVGKGFAYNEFPLYFSHRDCEDQYASVTINKLNAGYGFVTIDCHGDAGLNELINQDKYFVCYSISCWCGAYDTLAHGSLLITDTCIADGFVDTYADKGACAYLGNTRDGQLDYTNDYVQYLPSRTICQVGWFEGGEQASGSEEIIPVTLSITELPTIIKDNTTIKYSIPNQDDITISIYNSIGSCVWKCTQRVPSPGYYKQRVDVKDMTSGIYFVVLTQGREKVGKKIVLTK